MKPRRIVLLDNKKRLLFSRLNARLARGFFGAGKISFGFIFLETHFYQSIAGVSPARRDRLLHSVRFTPLSCKFSRTWRPLCALLPPLAPLQLASNSPAGRRPDQ